VTAIVLACVSALLFGAMSVGLRIGLGKVPDAELATVATIVGALGVVLVAAVVEAPFRGVHLSGAWPFLLAGLLQPGVGQLFVTKAIELAGASRSSVVFGIAPLVSVTIALVVLGEPASAPLILGAVLIVGGGIELARERARPEHVRRFGLVLAFVATVLFATRDNLLRHLAVGTSVPPAIAALAALVGGALVIGPALGPRLRGRAIVRPSLPFLVVGVFFGLSYVSLFEAYYRGRVTVVSPLIATESLWGIVLSIIFIREVEVVGRRLVIGALLVVAGGVLITAFR
jgi:drug/metabolite transporter (DMT)-like permease